MPGLTTSRSFGDGVAHSIGVSAVPEIKIHELTSKQNLIVLGSDGLFDYLNTNKIGKVCKT